ncbi:MAG: hypothetical protein VX595_14365 [Pseudomonadota bacterium]|uniref:hypothetical protein n=1 Tax=Alcanivorax sp. NBRC 102024 TaxID=1113895 RepID=UPI000789E14E|nr:hypothetical protein [Alcanivorax sp. NBRC 102024]MEE2604247.1 hypothetical protein [Pseudomonadota bacterium]
MIKSFLLSCLAILFFVSFALSWGRYDFLFFLSLLAFLLSAAQIYLMVVMDRFYVGMGVEIEKEWDDFEVKVQKIILLSLYFSILIFSVLFGFIRDSQ